MTAAAHTPGPWFDWEQMAWLYPPHWLLSNTADARLIAAAPELLEALEGALADIEAGLPQPHDTAEYLREIISKAKETPNG